MVTKWFTISLSSVLLIMFDQSFKLSWPELKNSRSYFWVTNCLLPVTFERKKGNIWAIAKMIEKTTNRPTTSPPRALNFIIERHSSLSKSLKRQLCRKVITQFTALMTVRLIELIVRKRLWNIWICNEKKVICQNKLWI